MSSSGQAPNVSMDELLASIKSMIEGESAGVSSLEADSGYPSDEEGGHAPADAFDDGIMDLTQIAKPPQQQKASDRPAPQADEPLQRELVQGIAQEFPQDFPIEERGQPYPGDQPFGMGDVGHPSSAAKETAAQINDILGGLGGERSGSDEMARGLKAPEAPLRRDMNGAPQGRDAFAQDPAQKEKLPAAGFEGLPYGAGEKQAAGGHPAHGQQAMAGQGQDPLSQAGAFAQGGAHGGAGVKAAPQQPQGQYLQGQQPQGQLGQGQHGQGQPGLGNQGHGNPGHGQPAFGQQGAGGYGQGHSANQGALGENGYGQNAPQGQPPLNAQHGTPPAAVGQQGAMGYDLRQESEYAMGQALRQADASLGAHLGGQPAYQAQLPAAPVARGWQPQAQAPYQGGAYGYDLPVPAAGRAMVPAVQPMLADPTADQLPVEMRNNLEEIVKQLLKPLLREWLERNLPELLRGAIDENGKIDPDRL